MQFIQEVFFIRYNVVSRNETIFECEMLIGFIKFARNKRIYYLYPLIFI